MLDALRAAKTVRNFYAAVALHLVEISPVLQHTQQQKLQALNLPLTWHGALDEVPDGPILVIANEFIDALPVYQAVKQDHGWHERVVDIAADGSFIFRAARDPLHSFEATLPPAVRQARKGAICEWRPDVIAFDLASRVRSEGVALIIDYGYTESAPGDTLQAVAGHSFSNPLQTPGKVDLTAHVDFAALAQRAESIGARCHGPLSQRHLLYNLGIHDRAALLKAKAPPGKADEIDLALSRLVAGGPRGMGELFKALAIADPKLGPLPGFEKPA